MLHFFDLKSNSNSQATALFPICSAQDITSMLKTSSIAFMPFRCHFQKFSASFLFRNCPTNMLMQKLTDSVA